MKPQGSRTPITVVNVSHLDDGERTLVLGVLLEEFLSWVRTLPGAQRLGALLVFDEFTASSPLTPKARPPSAPLSPS